MAAKSNSIITEPAIKIITRRLRRGGSGRLNAAGANGVALLAALADGGVGLAGGIGNDALIGGGTLSGIFTGAGPAKNGSGASTPPPGGGSVAGFDVTGGGGVVSDGAGVYDVAESAFGAGAVVGRGWLGNGGGGGVAGRRFPTGGRPEIPSEETGRLGGG